MSKQFQNAKRPEWGHHLVLLHKNRFSEIYKQKSTLMQKYIMQTPTPSAVCVKCPAFSLHMVRISACRVLLQTLGKAVKRDSNRALL